MDGNFSDVQRLLKNGQKSDSFTPHFEHPFKSTTPRMDLHKCMEFKELKQFNPIGSNKSFTKPNCNLCLEECLTILKKLYYKLIT